MGCSRAFDTLSQPELEKIQTKMRPGYLGPVESLSDTVKSDRDSLAELQVCAKTIVAALVTVVNFHWDSLKGSATTKEVPEDLIDIGATAMENRLDSDKSSRDWCLWENSLSMIHYNERDFLVFNYTWGGAALCPFQTDEGYHGYEYGSRDYCVVNLSSKRHVMFNDINLHIAATHDFWEGKETPYRLDPLLVIEVLGL